MLVDLSAGEDPAGTVRTVRGEVAAFDRGLAQRPWLLVGTKMDAVADRAEAAARLEALAARYGVRSVAISAATGEGIPKLVYALLEMAEVATVEAG